MKQLQIKGQGVMSARPFIIQITTRKDTTWLRAEHESGTATMVAAFPYAEFAQWITKSLARPCSQIELTGKRSRGEKSVEIRLKFSSDGALLTMVDQSGKITNTTILDDMHWLCMAASYLENNIGTIKKKAA